MNSVKKMILVPFNRYNNEKNAKKSDSLEDTILNEGRIKTSCEETTCQTILPKESLRDVLKILVDLSRINGFDKSGRILSLTKKKYIENSDIVMCLEQLMSSTSHNPCDDEFVNLLCAAKVEPNIVANKFVNQQLKDEIQIKVDKANKRARESTEKSQTSKRKKNELPSNWIIPTER